MKKKDEELGIKVADSDGRYFRMWEPLAFNIKEDYDYRRDSVGKCVSNILLRAFARDVLIVYNRLAFGFEVTGQENLTALEDRGFVSVCNHVHQMDCTMVDLALSDFRTYYMCLDVSFKIPLIRHIIRVLGAVPLTKNPRQVSRLMSEMGKVVKKGSVLQVYPEGVLYPYCRELREFHPGAFRFAVKSNAPLLPMVITQHKPEGIFALYKKKPCLHLNILPPLFPDSSLPEKEAAARLRDACLEEMRGCLRNPDYKPDYGEEEEAPAYN